MTVTYENGQIRNRLDLELTESAIEQVKKLLARDDRTGQVYASAVTDGGCSGHSYKLDFEKEQKADDTVLDRNGVKVLCR